MKLLDSICHHFKLPAFTVYALSVVTLASIGYLNIEVVTFTEHPVTHWFLYKILQHKFFIIIAAACYTAIYTQYISKIIPGKGKEGLKRKVMGLMFNEIFEKDHQAHRLTLFKEVNYYHALLIHLWYCARSFFKNPKKYKNYLKLLPYGSYLVVDYRVGKFKKSASMFKVNEDNDNECNGVVGYIRCNKMGAGAFDLPDISTISLDDVRSIKFLKKEDRPKVADYMRRGHVCDFDALKRFNRHARHLYGTILEAEQKIYGVLLADSTAETNIFTDENRAKFDGYSVILSAILDTGV